MAVEQAAGPAPGAATGRTPACKPGPCEPGPLLPGDLAGPARPADAILIEDGGLAASGRDTGPAQAEAATDPHPRTASPGLVAGPARLILVEPMPWRTAIGGVANVRGRGDAPPAGRGPEVPGR